jgi:hypothetical protein
LLKNKNIANKKQHKQKNTEFMQRKLEKIEKKQFKL